MSDRLPYSPSFLQEILADMVLSALLWDEHHERESEAGSPADGLTGMSRRIHCPSLDRRSKQEPSEREDEYGERNAKKAS